MLIGMSDQSTKWKYAFTQLLFWVTGVQDYEMGTHQTKVVLSREDNAEKDLLITNYHFTIYHSYSLYFSLVLLARLFSFEA